MFTRVTSYRRDRPWSAMFGLSTWILSGIRTQQPLTRNGSTNQKSQCAGAADPILTTVTSKLYSPRFKHVSINFNCFIAGGTALPSDGADGFVSARLLQKPRCLSCVHVSSGDLTSVHPGTRKLESLLFRTLQMNTRPGLLEALALPNSFLWFGNRGMWAEEISSNKHFRKLSLNGPYKDWRLTTGEVFVQKILHSKTSHNGYRG